MNRTASLLTAFLLFSCTAATNNPGSAPVAAPAAAFDTGFNRANLDSAANACNDFYQYANGGWLASNPIPAQYTSWGMLSQLNEENRELLRGLLASAANKPAAQRSPVEQKIGDFYASCMNEQAIDAAGVTPLQPYLAPIDAIRTPQDIQKVIVHFSKFGLGVPFNFGPTQDAKNSAETIADISQSGLGLPNRDYYFRTDERSQKIRDEYLGHVAKMFALVTQQPALPAGHPKRPRKRALLFIGLRLSDLQESPEWHSCRNESVDGWQLAVGGRGKDADHVVLPPTANRQPPTALRRP